MILLTAPTIVYVKVTTMNIFYNCILRYSVSLCECRVMQKLDLDMVPEEGHAL